MTDIERIKKQLDEHKDWAMSQSGDPLHKLAFSHAYALLAHIDRLEGGWISVDDGMPETCRPVLAYYKNVLGNGRTVRAELVGKHQMEDNGENDGLDMDYDESGDMYYWPAGWYENIENWGDLSHVLISDKVTHWMPIPAAPQQTEVSDG